MKIVFPKAEDYHQREDEFFDQMELALYHARKAWQKSKGRLSIRLGETGTEGEIALLIVTKKNAIQRFNPPLRIDKKKDEEII